MNKCYLPDLDIIKLEYNESGHTEFVRVYKKKDCFIGPPESIDFIIEMLKQEKGNSI